MDLVQNALDATAIKAGRREDRATSDRHVASIDQHLTKSSSGVTDEQKSPIERPGPPSCFTQNSGFNANGARYSCQMAVTARRLLRIVRAAGVPIAAPEFSPANRAQQHIRKVLPRTYGPAGVMR